MAAKPGFCLVVNNMEVNHTRRCFRLGFLINPYAGVGGPAGLKGSDAETTQSLAKKGKLVCKAAERARAFLDSLADLADRMEIHTVPGDMGAAIIDATWTMVAHHYPINSVTTAEDTLLVVKLLQQQNIDLLVFVGGDGTARDVCQVLSPGQCALGVPAGVKMQSAVYGINPQASANVVRGLIEGELIDLCQCEVRDLDENAYREGVVRSQFYGEMLVPSAPELIQQVKQGGITVDEHVLLGMADDIAERIDELKSDHKALIIFAPGSTTHFIQRQMGIEASLLGVDVLLPDGDVELDVNAEQLHALVDTHYQCYPENAEVKLVLTAIGGQGHIIGRGNQQITPRLLSVIGKHNLWVVAPKDKLRTLAGRAILMDSGDASLDAEWSGFIAVITDYREQVMYPLSGG